MLKHASVVISLAFASGLVAACGSSSDGGSENDTGNNGTGASGPSGGLDLDPDGSDNEPGTIAGDGGTVDLTDEQVTAIEDGACAGWTTEGEALPAVLELVVDVSGSMERQAPGSRMSKWAVTRDALSAAVDALGAQTAVGALYYPNRSTNSSDDERPVTACVNTEAMVPIEVLGAPGSPARDALQRSLTRANTGGGTPTHDAYLYALDNGMREYPSTASKFMLLITDGQPTFSLGCIGTGNVDDPVPEDPIVSAIEAAYADGIRTFVIGSPGSEENVSTGADARPWLSRAAKAGGTARAGCSDDGPDFCHMDMTQEPDFAAALADGLGEIAGQINTCTYAVPPPPSGQEIDLSKVNLIVHVDGKSQLVKPDTKGDCSEGWQLNDEQQVVLCDATCARVQEDTSASVQLLFGCASGAIEIPK